MAAAKRAKENLGICGDTPHETVVKRPFEL